MTALLGSRVVRSEPLAGGDINEVERVWLADGREVVRKRRGSTSAGSTDLFLAEAAGLRWLGEAGALAVPEVLEATPEHLVLAYLPPAAPVPDFDARLGRGLAELHRFGAPGWGWSRDNYIGPLPQRGVVAPPSATWSAFFGEHRLLVMARRADADRGTRFVSRIETLCGVLPALLEDDEPPSRLHGDLWGGNLHRDGEGRPVLIDPAVYGGHREVDLAMMRLFGGFAPRVFEAYDEAWPLRAGVQERCGLYQLYPLLVHVVLFGGSYATSVDATLRRHGC